MSGHNATVNLSTDQHYFTQSRPKVEIGWVLNGHWKPRRQEEARRASEDVGNYLSRQFPEYDWKIPISHKSQTGTREHAEPVSLLDVAELERDSQGWDFVFIFTESELVTFVQPFALAVTSRLYSAAVVSVARVSEGHIMSDRLSERLVVLALHLFGRLNGLSVSQSWGYMRAFHSADALDTMDGYSSAEIALLRERLASVADLRVEEAEGSQGTLLFYARSLKENRRELVRAVARMRPWLFPARFSRLLTAAASALLLLMVTAEAWELALNLRGSSVVVFSILALFGTSAYLLKAQRLLARGGDARLREQRVVRNVGTVTAVCIGMSVTYLAIFALSFLFGMLLFPNELVADWADRHDEMISLAARAQMAGFASMLGLVLGALGASFEPQGYFRHVTFVDEEI